MPLTFGDPYSAMRWHVAGRRGWEGDGIGRGETHTYKLPDPEGPRILISNAIICKSLEKESWSVFDLCDTFPTKLMLPEDPLQCFFGGTGRRVILIVLASTQLFKASEFCKPWGPPKCQTVSQGGQLHCHCLPLSCWNPT